MTLRRNYAQMVGLVASLVLLSACTAASAAQPTRAGVPPANIVATATVKAGGTPGGAGPTTPGSPGAQLFAAQGCNACHMVQGQGGAIGPNLTNIGTVAETRKPGVSAADYIRESIVNTNAFIAPGFQPGVMPGTYGQTLSPEQLDQLVAYLLEQK
jgi:mono/diheme cytochrome c family protein